MRKSFNNIKSLAIILILFITFFITSAYSYANNISEDLSENIFRLHILANSDSDEDQELKLKVRDAILDHMKELPIIDNNKDSVIQTANEYIDDFKTIAENIIHENGYDYPVNIEIGNFHFPTKYYGNISLPAGNYDALRIEIGDAKGQNWWCSLFPPLCFVSVSSGVIDEEGENYLQENLSQEEFAIVSDSSPDIKFKFKIIELLKD